MKKVLSIFVFAASAIVAFAQTSTQVATKPTLGIYGVKPVDGLKVGEASKRVMSAMDAHLASSFTDGRKFTVVARADWNSVLKEQDFAASGNVDASTAAKVGRALGAKYVLETTVTDFQDYIETATFATIGKTAQKRILRFGAVAKLYDSTSGVLSETASFTISNDDVADLPSYSVRTGNLNDALIDDIAKIMSKKIASRIADIAFPAKVISVIGNQIIINRGDASDISVGDIYKIVAQGAEMVDPDTGEKLGRAEADVGVATVTEVLPKYSKARLSENYGVETGAVARKAQTSVAKVQ